MSYRNKLIQATTMLLYMGPLLAGLAGFGLGYLIPFVSLFMLWLVMLRPHRWPQNLNGWLSPAAILASVTLLVTQILFVALLFGVGRGIGGVLGHLPMFHPLLPVALSFLAIPFLRLIRAAGGMLAGEEADDWYNEAASVKMRPISVSAEAAVSELFALSEDGRAGAELLLDKLDQFLDTGDCWSRLATLSAALEAGQASAHVALRTAIILKATDPFPQSDFTIPGEMLTAFSAAGTSTELLSLLSLRGRALLHKIPEAAHYFPPHDLVLDLAAACEESATAQALRDLAAALLLARSEDKTPGDKGRSALTVPKPASLRFAAPVASAQGA